MRSIRTLPRNTGEGYGGYWVWRFVLLKDRAFEEIVMAEKVLALVDYLVGEDCILSTLTTHIRGQGRSKDPPHGYLPLHGDDPHPHPGFHNAVTVNICLTDVTEESGCLAFVPGSHKLTRQPTPQERVLAGNDANPEAVPLVAPAGSAVIWPAHTWHGSWESPTPAMRPGKRRVLDKSGPEEAEEKHKASMRAKVEHPFLYLKGA